MSKSELEFTYKILEVEKTHILVEYPDGTNAQVPVFVNDDRESIVARIPEFYHPPEEGMSSAEMVPFVAGDIGRATLYLHGIEEETKEENFDRGEEVFSYEDFRQVNYPSKDKQLRAAYEARQGRPELQQEVDIQIKEIDELYPEDMPDMTSVEHIEYMENLIDL